MRAEAQEYKGEEDEQVVFTDVLQSMVLDFHYGNGIKGLCAVREMYVANAFIRNSLVFSEIQNGAS